MLSSNKYIVRITTDVTFVKSDITDMGIVVFATKPSGLMIAFRRQKIRLTASALAENSRQLA
jgi:hypothetical protein